MNLMSTARRFCASTVAKIGVATTALVASGAALAGGSTSPGAAIAAEVAKGNADMAIVIGAIALLLGILVVWAFTKRAAKG
ncbi:hypothetical protein K7430_02105 [Stenotrophomonas maltophilia]|nr:hypothetical protein [Stenotrophomonas maltophilia]EKU9962805.1 hypothetical protein [Stenotrophomonas maltophilia]MBY8923590.1 hypothetical protein [Stenotrophomonas maltophilia]